MGILAILLAACAGERPHNLGVRDGALAPCPSSPNCVSEHLGFALAYLLSASACVVLIGFYVSHVLRSARHGLSFSAGLAALYGLLYGLLSAEDYALLMGSLLLFGLLGVFMVLTRKLDWYGIGPGKSAKALEVADE